METGNIDNETLRYRDKQSELEVQKMRVNPYLRRAESESRFLSDAPRLFEGFENLFNFDRTNRVWIPTVDIIEKGGNLLLRVNLPGMEEKDFNLKLEGNVLTLHGERKLEKDVSRDDFHRLETYYGAFARSFTLPEEVDRDNISADYKNGVLTITIPQRPDVRPREIPVTAG